MTVIKDCEAFLSIYQSNAFKYLEEQIMFSPVLGKFFILSLLLTSIGISAETANGNLSEILSDNNILVDKETSPSAVADNFSELEAERARVTTEMYSIMYQISGYFTELERTRMLESQRDSLKALVNSIQDDEKLEQLNSRLDIILKQLENIRKSEILPNLRSVSGNSLSNFTTIEASEGIRRILESHVSKMLKGTDSLNAIGSKVAELNNTDSVAQDFKAQISWSFAALVGAVIIGFFYIAHGDEKVRRTIFSGDSGIQFLTLFSIVIAIILFGITGVLEGKEISALIGGISGYILGRSSVPGENNKNEVSENDSKT